MITFDGHLNKHNNTLAINLIILFKTLTTKTNISLYLVKLIRTKLITIYKFVRQCSELPRGGAPHMLSCRRATTMEPNSCGTAGPGNASSNWKPTADRLIVGYNQLLVSRQRRCARCARIFARSGLHLDRVKQSCAHCTCVYTSGGLFFANTNAHSLFIC